MNIPAGLVTMACTGGTYTDEATQTPNTLAPSLMRAATIYSGTGPLTILASPLSEVAYLMANTGDITTDIMQLNTKVATAFGVLNGIDIISTIPSNANAGPVANDQVTAPTLSAPVKVGVGLVNASFSATLATAMRLILKLALDWKLIISLISRSLPQTLCN
jgi:hypothetical protein